MNKIPYDGGAMADHIRTQLKLAKKEIEDNVSISNINGLKSLSDSIINKMYITEALLDHVYNEDFQNVDWDITKPEVKAMVEEFKRLSRALLQIYEIYNDDVYSEIVVVKGCAESINI